MTDRVAAIAAELGLRQPEITPLSGGLSNRSWRLRDATLDLVLRLSGAVAGELGADGRAELAMLEIAASAGLAPQVVLARPDQGILVTRYVGGHVLTRTDVSPARNARAHRGLVRATTRAGAAAESPGRGFRRARRGLPGAVARRSPTPLIAGLERQLVARRRSLPPPRRLVACHHDLHHLNLVDLGDALIALDWEYAGPGDPAADLAACIGYHDLDSAAGRGAARRTWRRSRIAACQAARAALDLRLPVAGLDGSGCTGRHRDG